MLDNTITLAVDTENTGTTTNLVITRIDEFQNRSKYKTPSHSFTLRDTVDFYRTYPSKTKDFNGMAKSSFKLTCDIEVPGVIAEQTRVAPMIGEVSFSLPVGFTTAEVKLLRQRIIAILDNDALMGRLNEGLEV